MTYGLAATLGLLGAAAEAAGSFTTDEQLGWVIRGVITIGLMAVTYLLRDIAVTVKETKRVQENHTVLLATHGIMFDQWLSTLNAHEIAERPGRRDSDKLLLALLKAREVAP